MPGGSFYKTARWRELRAAVIRRARGRCEVPGCAEPGTVVDHILSRRAGGADSLTNLRLLCRRCDDRLRQDASGQRRRGFGPDGSPLDSAHRWHRDPD